VREGVGAHGVREAWDLRMTPELLEGETIPAHTEEALLLGGGNPEFVACSCDSRGVAGEVIGPPIDRALAWIRGNGSPAIPERFALDLGLPRLRAHRTGLIAQTVRCRSGPRSSESLLGSTAEHAAETADGLAKETLGDLLSGGLLVPLEDFVEHDDLSGLLMRQETHSVLEGDPGFPEAGVESCAEGV
jgi:hypothetical protein